jgi:hypothetical protein
MRDSYVLLNDMCVRVWCVCVCLRFVLICLSRVPRHGGDILLTHFFPAPEVVSAVR